MNRYKVANWAVSVAMFPLLLVLMGVWSLAGLVGRARTPR